MNLSISNCHGQCYGGANNMSGIRQGTATKFLLQEQHTLYNHCYGHALNLAVGDSRLDFEEILSTLVSKCLSC